jgi:hypothetical protein
MKQIDNEAYIKALEEIKNRSETINPVSALLLINTYPHKVLEDCLDNLPIDVNNRITIRFHLINKLLQNRKNNFNSQAITLDESSQKVRYDRTLCDFKEVMSILGRSKGTVEALIKEHKINPIPDKPKAKRSFIKAEIIRYAERSQ